MDDECDFESLAALLTEDDEEESNKTSPSTSDSHKGETKPQNVDNDDSSGDDIDDDELDKLAALVEEPESTPGPEAREQQEKRLTGASCDAKDPGNTLEPKSDHLICVENDIKNTDGHESANESGAESEEDLALKEQLRQMQEQMALMAAKLQKKKKKKSSPEPSNVSEGSSTNAAKEFNIFDVIDQEKNATNGKESRNQPKVPVHNTSTSQKSEPWERKKSVPMTGYKLSAAVPKQKTVDREFEAKLSSTVNQIKEKQTAKEQQQTAAGSNFYAKKTESESLEQNLFGSDNDSDWSDLDGEKPSELSKEGKELVKSLKKRVAHPAKYDASDLEKYRDKPKTSWNQSVYGNAMKNGLAAQNNKMPPAEEQDKDVLRDPYSGIRVIKPLISSSEMKRRMTGRKMIKMSHLFTKRNTSAVEGDWVTIGVVAQKGEPRMSQNNKQFSVWKMTDLEDCDQIVNLFLFGECHKAHWKIIQGTVIGLLNPTIMKSAEKYAAKDQNSVSIMFDDKNKLMEIGTSKDLGLCRAKTKAGKPCTSFINRSKQEYCTYHVQAQYKKMSAKRGELSSGFSGVTPKSSEKKLFTNKNCIVTYGGKTYTSQSLGTQGVKKKKDQVKVAHLQSHFVNEGNKNKVSTLALHNLIPEDKQKLKEYNEKVAEKERSKIEKHKTFHEMLSVPTVGSMNFVKHLVKKEQIQVESNTKAPVRSITAKELLQMAGNAGKNRTSSNRPTVSGDCAPPAGPQPSGPSLGRGLAPGVDLEFDLDAPVVEARPSKAHIQKELSKKKAIAKVIANGGIKKENPNAVKKSSTDVKAKVEKRLAEAAFEDAKELSGEEPAKKKSRLLGDVDLNDPEVQKLLKKKSSHAAALTEEELEKQEAYFSVLEKKEAMEDQMDKVTKQKCTAVICHECKYKALSAAQRCKDERHKLTYDKNAIKRWFKCNGCSSKVASLDKYPAETCRNCGSSSFTRSSMLYEKKGPKLPSEQLLLRGEERKFVNS